MRGETVGRAHAKQACMEPLERGGLQGGQEEEQPILWRREGAVLLHATLAGGPEFPLEAPRRHRGVEGGLEGRDQVLQLVARHAGAVQELHGAGLQVGTPDAGPLGCLLS
jgi:hypothetical protein